MTKKPSVLLAEDHPLVLSALRSLVDADPGLRLIDTCTDGLAAISAVQVNPPDVAVVDVNMPGLSGLKFLEEVRSRNLPVGVVLFTAEIGDRDIYDAVTGGVDGIVFKRSAPDTLLECIHAVAAGARYLSDPAIETAIERQRQRQQTMNRVLGPLSARERDVAMIVASHLSNKEIADALTITEGTVKVHLHSIFMKLDVTDRSSLRSLVLQVVG